VPKPKTPAAGSRRGKPKTTKAGRKIIAGLEEAAAYMRGEHVPGLVVHRSWDVSSALDTPERVALYLEEAKVDDDPKLTAAAIGDVARATRKYAKRRRT
jgi:hypothetical protein